MEDYIVRATAADHQIRAFAITSKEMVEQARSIHNTSPVATAALGRLLTAGAMMGSMMKGDADLLTLQIKGAGAIGGGFGHGIGMSQYGADGMAQAGYSCDEILGFFYHDVKIESIY